MIVPSAFLVFIILAWINAFKIFKEVYFIGGAYPDEAVYTLQNYMNNMFGKLNYQNVTTAAYSFALIVFAHLRRAVLSFSSALQQQAQLRRPPDGNAEKNPSGAALVPAHAADAAGGADADSHRG